MEEKILEVVSFASVFLKCKNSGERSGRFWFFFRTRHAFSSEVETQSRGVYRITTESTPRPSISASRCRRSPEPLGFLNKPRCNSHQTHLSCFFVGFLRTFVILSRLSSVHELRLETITQFLSSRRVSVQNRRFRELLK